MLTTGIARTAREDVQRDEGIAYGPYCKRLEEEYEIQAATEEAKLLNTRKDRYGGDAQNRYE